MKVRALIINDTSDMISTGTAPESGESSMKTEEEPASPLNGRGSSSSPAGDGGDWLSEEEDLLEKMDLGSGDAPSDEEGGLKKSKIVRHKWEIRDERAKSSNVGDPPASGGGGDHPPATPKSAFSNAKLKWDNKTASMTKKKVDDLLSPSSWHGRITSTGAPLRNTSAPKVTRHSVQTGALTIPTVFQNNSADDRSSSPSEPRGNIDIPSAFRSGGDDESIGVPPTSKNAKSKFTAMSESQNLESSTTSFITELPQIPRRRRYEYDNDGNSIASSVIRGGRVFKIFSTATQKPVSSIDPQQAGSRPSSRPTSSHTRASATSADSTDGDITEYESATPSRSVRRSSDLARSESGSSHNISIGTYDDEAGTPRQEDMPLETIPSIGSGEAEYEIVPIKDAPPRKRDTDFEDYEEELRIAEDLGDNDFVVDKVPKKKRWSSKNIHNFPVWPPIIKVQTWQKKNVSAVSVGSGFTLDDSFTDSNAVVSSLGDDDASYDESEFIRRPPEHRTSYRIRYDGPTSLRLGDVYKGSIGMDSNERFDPTGKQPSQGLPSMPARRVTDAAPSAPPRSSSALSDDEMSVTLSQVGEGEVNRPDVWITSFAGSLSAEAMWKVKRIWAVEDEDEKEQEHDVHNNELFEKIKHLVGASKDAPDGTASGGGAVINNDDNAPRLPERSWHVQTVYEKKGHVENVAAEKALDAQEFEKDMDVMAQEAVKEIEKNEKIFEEYRKKREERQEEENWALDVVGDEDPDVVKAFKERVLEAEGETQQLPEPIVDSAEQTMAEDSPNVSEARVTSDVKCEDDSGIISDPDDNSIQPKNDDDDLTSPRRRAKKPKKKKTTKSTNSSSPKSPKSSKKSHKADVPPSTPSSSRRASRMSSSTPSRSASTPTRKLSSKSKLPVDGLISSPGLIPPRSPKKSSKNGISPRTPRGGKKSKSKVATPKPPKDEKKKKTKKHTKERSKDDTEAKEKATPRSGSLKKVVSMSQMVQGSEDIWSSSDDDGKGSFSSQDGSTSDDQYEELTTSASGKPASARLSLAAMVHDSSDSELDAFDSDDLSAADSTSVAPRILQPGVSPRAGWWNTPSGRKSGRRSVPAAGVLPPPLTENKRTSSKTG